jgi:hypothetical protein
VCHNQKREEEPISCIWLMLPRKLFKFAGKLRDSFVHNAWNAV